MKNNIAILILAHHNLEQLCLLINHLRIDFDVYVQIDKKSKINIQELPNYKNVLYYKEVDVYWGHFSQILNMKFILNKAFEKSYQRYCFISGDDFPIKSNTYIYNFFKENKESIYMFSNPLPIATWGFNKGFDRIERYWFMTFHNRTFVKILGRITLIVQRFLFIKINKFPLKYYAGSNWLNLTHESVKHIFKFLKENPRYLRKLKYSRATDEIWIQSIIMNSPLKSKVINNDLRYIDWNTGPEFPRILNLSDFHKIKKSEALFARKINMNSDKKILEKIIQLIKN
ncbi:beta-1,6-N-acetylglucosaminyltransferase [Thalassobellus sediminis]|uniref:beta-1,6-N-acetylglucosaminyltransferase n=1 Tax=Thalassobellus sediminis TaxID=3367753 RepID=UPI003796BDD9